MEIRVNQIFHRYVNKDRYTVPPEGKIIKNIQQIKPTLRYTTISFGLNYCYSVYNRISRLDFNRYCNNVYLNLKIPHTFFEKKIL